MGNFLRWGFAFWAASCIFAFVVFPADHRQNRRAGATPTHGTLVPE